MYASVSKAEEPGGTDLGIRLKNKPLVEAILELKWQLQEGPGGMNVDPNYRLLLATDPRSSCSSPRCSTSTVSPRPRLPQT